MIFHNEKNVYFQIGLSIIFIYENIVACIEFLLSSE
jgi:hypothetical protein